MKVSILVLVIDVRKIPALSASINLVLSLE